MTAARKSFCKYCHAARWTGPLQDAICTCGYSRSAIWIFPDARRLFARTTAWSPRGVTQCGQEVTAVAEKYGPRRVHRAFDGKQLGMDVFPVDIDCTADKERKSAAIAVLARNCKNFAHEPAMTRKEALESVEIGIKNGGNACRKRIFAAHWRRNGASATRLRARQSRRRSLARRLRRSQDAERVCQRPGWSEKSQ